MPPAVDPQAAPAATKRSESPLEATDNRAFEANWPAVEASVYRFLLAKTGDCGLSEDLTNVTGLRVARMLQRNPKAIQWFKGYCLRVALRLTYDNHRKSANDILNSACQIADHCEPVALPSREELNEELRSMLREMMPQLPEQERAVANGVLDGKTTNEIGADIGRTPRRVRQILNSIGECAREFFGSDWFSIRAGRHTASGVEQ